jgi:hypothetical protein
LKTAPALVLLLTAAACGAPGVPQYMEDFPQDEAAAQLVVAGIRRELGEATRVERVEEYFFVATNDTPYSFTRSRETVSVMVRHLYAHYFERKPEKPIRVYLFRDKQTYEEHCEAAYGRPPSTPFGFYMSAERKMVMNIATGTGTLAHELVHPLLAEDFPDVPSWFNEGFASLYEQSAWRGDRMVGLVNWRLPALQKALQAGTAIPLRELLGSTPARFYGDGCGVNYASARYLCLFLQERGHLAAFYRAFKAGFKDDPAGVAALEKAAGAKLDALETAWREWVLKLRPEP